MNDFLALFNQETDRLKNTVERGGDDEIFPPFPTRNDFSGKEQVTDKSGFPTFPTFPTASDEVSRGDRFQHGFRDHDRGVTAEPQADETARVEVLHENGGKVGNPTESIFLRREKWEKWENPVSSSFIQDAEEDRASFDERAAILEFDGGFDRPEAEALAGEQMTALRVRRPASVGRLTSEQATREGAGSVCGPSSLRSADGAEMARSEAGFVKREHVA